MSTLPLASCSRLQITSYINSTARHGYLRATKASHSSASSTHLRRPRHSDANNVKNVTYRRTSYSSLSTGSPPERIDLAHEIYRASESDSLNKGPIIILHGLFGSKQNWRSVSKALSAKTGRDVWAMDLRNHGNSPHSRVMDYHTMAADVATFIEQKKLENVALLGHSMGGKVAMALALTQSLNQHLDKLIIEDIAPTPGSISQEFIEYVQVLTDIQQSGRIRSRKEADDYMKAIVPDASIRAFLLTNLLPITPSSPTASFRVPLDYIHASMQKIGDFTFDPSKHKWEGDTLVIKGARSNYINKRNTPSFSSFFPNSQFETLDTDHWVHAEKPQEFIDLLVKFLG